MLTIDFPTLEALALDIDGSGGEDRGGECYTETA